MNKEFFVQNVKKLCLERGIKPTNACKESGVGGSFLSDINRGQTPSIEKVETLANYLGVTVSELIGEEKPTPAAGDGLAERAIRLDAWFQSLPPETRKAILTLGGGPEDLAE